VIVSEDQAWKIILCHQITTLIFIKKEEFEETLYGSLRSWKQIESIFTWLYFEETDVGSHG
jgi:hypothetical protein